MPFNSANEQEIHYVSLCRLSMNLLVAFKVLALPEIIKAGAPLLAVNLRRLWVNLGADKSFTSSKCTAHVVQQVNSTK